MINTVLQNTFVQESSYIAHEMLVKHANNFTRPAILGFLNKNVHEDYKYKDTLENHISVGEFLAQSSLQTEILVCSVVGVSCSPYVGRGQYTTFEEKPAVPKNGINCKFSCPAANYWGTLNSLVGMYFQVRNNDYTHMKYVRLIRKLTSKYDTHGNALTFEELVDFKKALPTNAPEWKGELPDRLEPGGVHIKEVLADPDHFSDLVFVSLLAVSESYKSLAKKCSLSAKSWKQFCLSQLKYGAGVLHKFVNRENACLFGPSL